MKRARWAVFLMVLAAQGSVLASQGVNHKNGFANFAEWAQVSGSLRIGYWSSSRTLDAREHLAAPSLWLKAEPKFGRNVSLVVEGWIRNARLFREDETWGELREAYLDVTLGPVDLRLGKQIIVWGRADRLNPTDNLTPRNFTLLVPEDDDQRLGVPAVKATYYLGSLSLTGVWLPDFIPYTIPIPRLPPPITLSEWVPEEIFGQWAIKIEQTGKAVDWSLSYFDGFDLSPDVRVARVSASAVDLLLTHNRIRVIGADAATTVGRYGFRGEAAYTFTEDTGGNNPLVKNPFFFMVVGSDRTFREYLNVNFQYFLRVVRNFRNPTDIADPLRRNAALQLAAVSNQRDQVQQGASMRVSYKWFNETLEGEIAGVLSFTRLDYVVRPKVIYAFTDRWKGTLGADVFRGSGRTFFGRLQDNSTVYVELRYSF